MELEGRADKTPAVEDRHGSSDSEPAQNLTEETKRPQRHANVYDAVAGEHLTVPTYAIQLGYQQFSR